MNQPQELLHRIGNWLESEGYPLEFRTAREFRRHRMGSAQGQYVRHSDSGVAREIDVLGTVTVRTDRTLLRLYTVTECKYSLDKPWVVFTSSAGISPSACIAQTISSPLGDAVLWLLTGDNDLHELDLFAARSRIGHGGRRAFEGSNDVFYNTAQAVVTATRLLCDEHTADNAWSRMSLPEVGSIAFPLIVIDAPLFECRLADDGESLVPTEVRWARMQWRGAESWTLHATVDIVQASALPEFLNRRSADLRLLARRARDVIVALEKGFDERTTRYLPHSQGSTGRRGGPSVIASLQAMEEDREREEGGA